VLYNGTGNGALPKPQWTVAALNVFASFDVPVSSTSRTIICIDGTACLSSFTTYVVSIAVIRQGTVESPFISYISTARTVLPIVKRDVANFFYFDASFTLDLAIPIMATAYETAVPLAHSPLAPVFLTNKNNDLHFNLTGSSIQTLSDGKIKIMMTEDEFNSVTVMFVSAPAFSAVTIHFAGKRSIETTFQCLYRFLRDLSGQRTI
jgi:hypothetical protein